MKKLLWLAVLLAAGSAQAEVFKCKDEYGKVTYQPKPCTAAAQDPVKIKSTDPAVIAAAQAKLQAELKVQAEKEAVEAQKQKEYQEQANSQALVGAMQNAAQAQQDQAVSQRRTANALEIGNIINAYRRW